MWTKLCQVSITYVTLARKLYGHFELFSQLLGVIVKFGGQAEVGMFWILGQASNSPLSRRDPRRFVSFFRFFNTW